MEVVAGYVRAATAALLQGAQTSSDLDLAMRALQVQGALEERGIGAFYILDPGTPTQALRRAATLADQAGEHHLRRRITVLLQRLEAPTRLAN